MLFHILGPIRVGGDLDEVRIPPGREQTLLAALLLGTGSLVTVEQLIEALWPGVAPVTARNQVHKCIHQIRSRLGPLAGDLLVTEPTGYRVTVDSDSLDLLRFRRLLREARAARQFQRLDVARDRFRSALGLRRGLVLGGIDSDLIQRAAGAIEGEITEALVECVRVELALGGGGAVVAELTELVNQHPYREDLHGGLMLALYRSGRQADALAAYRRIRQLLDDELGTEPRRELRQLHHAILNSDPALMRTRPVVRLALTGGQAVPRQLPAEVAGFTGRADALRRLDEFLPAGDGAAGPVPISVITGPAGVGKTALAVHWAHRVADRFPDGQLFLDLLGHPDGPPLGAMEALAALLRVLGVPPTHVPTEVAQAAGAYRSQLAGRRVLLVLDNAASADQVRPLLPGTPGCLVLVTSRDRFGELVARDGARRLTLEGLTPAEARELLGRLLGTERVETEPAAVAALATACRHLPLSLRLAAADLLDHPDRSIGNYLAGLAGADQPG